MNETTRRTTPRGKRRPVLPDDPTQEDLGGLPREWKGSGKYNRGDRIGKGAFATVYKVTSKFDGRPFAAKELDKRKFMKNGVLDQKVENEMKIMQRAKHVRRNFALWPSVHRILIIDSPTLSNTSSTWTGTTDS